MRNYIHKFKIKLPCTYLCQMLSELSKMHIHLQNNSLGNFFGMLLILNFRKTLGVSQHEVKCHPVITLPNRRTLINNEYFQNPMQFLSAPSLDHLFTQYTASIIQQIHTNFTVIISLRKYTQTRCTKKPSFVIVTSQTWWILQS